MPNGKNTNEDEEREAFSANIRLSIIHRFNVEQASRRIKLKQDAIEQAIETWIASRSAQSGAPSVPVPLPVPKSERRLDVDLLPSAEKLLALAQEVRDGLRELTGRVAGAPANGNGGHQDAIEGDNFGGGIEELSDNAGEIGRLLEEDSKPRKVVRKKKA